MGTTSRRCATAKRALPDETLQLPGSIDLGRRVAAYSSGWVGWGPRRCWPPSADPLGGGSVESASVLESIAEVAIALAGFGGIAAGLGYRARGSWSRDDQLRLMLLASAGLAVVFACFLPYVTYHLGSSAPWRLAGALFLVVVLFGLLYQVWFFRRRITQFGNRILPAAYSRIASWLVFTTQIVALALLFAVVLGYAGPREFGFYLSAVLLLLVQAALFFVRLLITSFRTSEPAA